MTPRDQVAKQLGLSVEQVRRAEAAGFEKAVRALIALGYDFDENLIRILAEQFGVFELTAEQRGDDPEA